jgi:paired amphipathic helix protein Sin3a
LAIGKTLEKLASSLQTTMNFLCTTVDGFNDDVELRKPIMARELQYFERVKARLRANRDAYPDLIRSINLYNQEILSKNELLGIVSDILGKYPDLMVRSGTATMLNGESLC